MNRQQLRERGRQDHIAGLPIAAYYDIPANLKPHKGKMNTADRSTYEMGWREQRDKGNKMLTIKYTTDCPICGKSLPLADGRLLALLRHYAKCHKPARA